MHPSTEKRAIRDRRPAPPDSRRRGADSQRRRHLTHHQSFRKQKGISRHDGPRYDRMCFRDRGRSTMKRFSVLLAGLAFALSAMAADPPGPDWAFMTPDPNAPAPASSRQAAPTDQQPGAPAVVVSGNGAAAPACSICHGASGVGGPQSANLRGQDEEYIVRQMKDFKSGARGSPLSGGGAIAKVLTDAESQEAAKYYAGLSPMRSARIIESTSAPKTTV